ncbi:MAG: pyridoxamine 5'-phosphate oxidase [Caldilineae bacterium]|nr:MAG: pyridoxamine 5'-phosphate oxidase [Caldilineae bacterium]
MLPIFLSSCAELRPSPVSLSDRIYTFLNAHNTLSLATVADDGTPHACALFYAVAPDLTLYFLSDPNTLHGRHLESRPRVAATVEANNQDWKDIRGIQLRGRAGRCPATDLHRARALYAARFPFVARAETLAGPLQRACYYRLVPDWIRLIDNTLGFGHKEEWHRP